jgi:hypothetical protein
VTGSCTHGSEILGSIKPGNFWTAEYLFIRISRRTELRPVEKSVKYMVLQRHMPEDLHQIF